MAVKIPRQEYGNTVAFFYREYSLTDVPKYSGFAVSVTDLLFKFMNEIIG